MRELEREINKDIRRIGHQVRKADALNTNNNKHYYQRLRLLRWLIMLKLIVKDMDYSQIADIWDETDRHMISCNKSTPKSSTLSEGEECGEKS